MTAVLIILAIILALVIASGLFGAGPSRVRRRVVVERPVRRRWVEVVDEAPTTTHRVIE